MKLSSIQGIPLEYIQSILKIDENSPSGLIWLPRKNALFNKNHANKFAGYKQYRKIKNAYYYWEIKLKYNKKQLTLYVTEIVFLLHHGYLTSGNTINYKDGNHLNNKIENLEELTPFEKECNRKLDNKPPINYKKLKSIKGIPLSYIKSIIKIDENSPSGLTWLPREDQKWNCTFANKHVGYKHKTNTDYYSWRVKISYKGKGKNFLCSRIIFLLHNGYLTEKKYVDHKDGNSLNNHVENLREATFPQNSMNSKIQKNNSSGCPGVDWHKDTQKWQARVRCNCKTFYFGLYDDEQEAIKVVTDARKKLHGDFNRDNR